MDNILLILKEYFKRLTKTGYFSYPDVYRILAYIFLNDMLHNELHKYSSDKKDAKIINVIHSMGLKDCVIPKYTYTKNEFDDNIFFSSVSDIDCSGL